jgi:2-polyprenyl-6-methoxyphenol hydroxylase-like FAD-dependent oxidoreductase
VAGLTTAGLLRGERFDVDIVEKEPEGAFNSSGYMLGLLPLGGRVLNELGLRDSYRAKSIEMERYRIHAADGRVLHDYPLDFINDEYGSYRGVSRQDLVDTLLESIDRDRIRFGTTVVDFGRGRRVVGFSDGSSAEYDLIIGADGLYSTTRSRLLEESEIQEVETGWGGWVTWLDEEPEPAYDEFWGSGSFLGLYPVSGRIGVFLGGPVETIRQIGLPDFADRVAAGIDLGGDLPHRALGALTSQSNPYFWTFEDRRSDVWHRANVVLLGDAATGFLPTAGVGASMAMDSAAALADELSRMEPGHLDYALDLYEKRQRDRVERAQRDSRRLGRIMFVRSTVLTALRDRVLPHYSLQRMLADLSKVMQGG